MPISPTTAARCVGTTSLATGRSETIPNSKPKSASERMKTAAVSERPATVGSARNAPASRRSPSITLRIFPTRSVKSAAAISAAPSAIPKKVEANPNVASEMACRFCSQTPYTMNGVSMAALRKNAPRTSQRTVGNRHNERHNAHSARPLNACGVWTSDACLAGGSRCCTSTAPPTVSAASTSQGARHE